MNTVTPPTRARRLRRDLVIVLGLLAALPLFLAACEIIEVLQPSEAAQGEVIEVTVTVEQPYSDTNPHRGVLSVLVPEDWSFVSGTYSGDAGPGDMVEDEGWADSTTIVLPPPAGMKWIGTVSEEAHDVPSAPAFFDATLQLQVGQEVGDFDLGYFTTNDAFGTGDIVFGDNEDNTADTLMNVPITVKLSSANDGGAAPETFTLAQNHPNPFAASTTVGFTLARAADVRVVVYDALGREVAVLVEGRRAPGSHAVTLDARGLPAGTYLYRLEVAGEVVATRRMTRAR
jgi:hypothetical protein